MFYAVQSGDLLVTEVVVVVTKTKTIFQSALFLSWCIRQCAKKQLDNLRVVCSVLEIVA